MNMHTGQEQKLPSRASTETLASIFHQPSFQEEGAAAGLESPGLVTLCNLK